MTLAEISRLAGSAAWSERLRSALTILGIAIGIASVVLLTSIGEGTRRFVLSEFSQFGTNLMAINPGKVKTMGIPGVLGGTTHPLSLEDAEALRRIPEVQRLSPLSIGTATVEYGGRSRAVNVYGSSSDLPDILKIGVRQGRYLPEADPFRPAPLAVLGPKLKRELFGESSALGRRVRVGGRRFQVIGVMEPKGSLLNIDLDDCIYIPVGAAMDLFNQTELWEIDILFSGTSPAAVVEKVAAVLKERHDGADDVTITTQAEMLSVLGRVLDVVTTAVGAIGGVALLVGGIGILTVMWISVNERVAEIGLCRSIGATSGQILLLFLAEAAALAGAGGVLGVAGALALGWMARILVPGLPFYTPPEYMAAAIALSIAVGLASGTLPARRAAHLDPVDALRAE